MASIAVKGRERDGLEEQRAGQMKRMGLMMQMGVNSRKEIRKRNSWDASTTTLEAIRCNDCRRRSNCMETGGKETAFAREHVVKKCIEIAKTNRKRLYRRCRCRHVLSRIVGMLRISSSTR